MAAVVESVRAQDLLIQKVSTRRYLPAGAAARGDVGRLPVKGPARRALPPPAVNTRGRDRQIRVRN